MASTLDVIKRLQHLIDKHHDDEKVVLRCIDKLYHLGVTVQHLQETGVGRTVNALRKEAGAVGTASRALVNKWKLMVASEENSDPEDYKNDTTNYNGHGNGQDYDEYSQSRNDNENRDHTSSKSSNQNHYRDMNGSHSGSKRKYGSSEESYPDTKKLRNDHSSDDRDIKPNIKFEQPTSESDDNSISDDSETSRLSDKEVKVKQEIKTESDYEGHKSSNHSYNKDLRQKPKTSSSIKLEKNTLEHSNESRHSIEKSSSKDKSSSSHKQSKEKEKSETKHKSEKSSDQIKGSSSKHSNSSERSKSSSKHKESSSSKEKITEKSNKNESRREKHQSKSEKHKSKSEKYESRHGTEKNETKGDITEKKNEKHRSSSQSHKSDKETLQSPPEKHKSKESSKTKHHSSSEKEKSRDRSSSSKDKTSHSKSEKKHSSSTDSKSKSKDKSSSSKKESKHKSSSSSSHKSSSKSSSSNKDDVPKIAKPANSEDSDDDGIGCESGASFAEALGMISPAKPKKKPLSIKDFSSPIDSFDTSDLGPASLLAPTARLAPLPPLEISALPEISPNYRPRPPPKLLPHFTDDEAMSCVISSKNQRTKVYSGNKMYGKLPSLYELCVNVLQEHIDALEYTGGVPYEILKPVVDKATPQQLYMLEHFNAYLMEDTDHLWQKFCEKHFRTKQRQELETWREMYMRCQEEQEYKLKSLTANIKIAQEAKKAPIKQTKMAYVDTVVKPPRNIARKQALHGTARTASASPASRVASLATAPNVMRPGAIRAPNAAPVPTSSFNKPKKAPLMQKALQFMRGRKR